MFPMTLGFVLYTSLPLCVLFPLKKGRIGTATGFGDGISAQKLLPDLAGQSK